MSCTERTDKALRGEIGSFWVNKQPASSTKMPEIGFSWATLQVRGLGLPGIRRREILSCTCLFWFRYLHSVHMGSADSPSREQCCWERPAVAMRKRYHALKQGVLLTLFHCRTCVPSTLMWLCFIIFPVINLEWMIIVSKDCLITS